MLISSKQLEVRLRPELRAGEDFIEDVTVEQALKQGALADSEKMLELFTEVGRSTPPESLLASIIDTLFHRYYGMEALALASIVEREKFSEKIVGLPALPEVAESAEQKMAIARIWLRQWQKNGFLLNGMPQAWRQIRIKPHTGSFAGMRSVLPTKPARTEFDKNWLPKLREWFCNPIPGGRFWLNGGNLTLAIRRRMGVLRDMPNRSTALPTTDLLHKLQSRYRAYYRPK